MSQHNLNTAKKLHKQGTFIWTSANKSWAVSKEQDGTLLLWDLRSDAGHLGSATELSSKTLNHPLTPAYVRRGILAAGVEVTA